MPRAAPTARVSRTARGSRAPGLVRSGLDLLLLDPQALRGRRFGLLCHQAALDQRSVPCHQALVRSGFAPAVLLGPEHGFYGVEQDMVAAGEQLDPWTGVPILSLYGDGEHSLRPSPQVFSDLDLLVIDLQDVGTRYYTFAASAVWAAEVAISCGCQVWVLDRPNPLGGEALEGNLPEPGFASFVGAFCLPVRHGLTLGELMRLEARRRGWPSEALAVFQLTGWSRSRHWPDLGLPWVAPSPNMPDYQTALLYPGGCLIEATELSEGRGTTRPFRLIGAPGVDPLAVVAALAARDLPGVRFVPVYFRPQFQKHAGAVCAGVEVVVTEPRAVSSFACGIEILMAFRQAAPQALRWRAAPYEFRSDLPALDLLAGSTRLRAALEAGDRSALATWEDGFAADLAALRAERADVVLYRSTDRP